MCGSGVFDNLANFRKHKLAEDLTPSLNPQKHLKTKLKNDFDFNNAQTAQERAKASLNKQNSTILSTNLSARDAAPEGSLITATGQYKPKKTTLLTQPTSLLG